MRSETRVSQFVEDRREALRDLADRANARLDLRFDECGQSIQAWTMPHASLPMSAQESLEDVERLPHFVLHFVAFCQLDEFRQLMAVQLPLRIVFQKGCCINRSQRLRKIISLCIFALKFRQYRKLLAVLHAFGDHIESETLGQG